MTLQDKAELLRHSYLFEGLTDEELAHIALVSQEVDYQPHKTIIEQGMPAKAAYVIFSGNAKAYMLTEEGKEIPLSLIKEGDLCGEMCIRDRYDADPLLGESAEASTDPVEDPKSEK